MSNRVRAGIISLAQSIFPVLVLVGVDLSSDAIAAIMLVITNTVTLLALLFPGPTEVVEVEPEAAPLERADLMRTVAPLESKSVIKQ
jgi:hypothetical protein